MTTKLRIPLTRETDVIDRRTGRPILIKLMPGGSLIRLWPKGHRTAYTVPLTRILHLGALIAAEEIKAAKRAKREARKSLTGRG